MKTNPNERYVHRPLRKAAKVLRDRAAKLIELEAQALTIEDKQNNVWCRSPSGNTNEQCHLSFVHTDGTCAFCRKGPRR